MRIINAVRAILNHPLAARWIFGAILAVGIGPAMWLGAQLAPSWSNPAQTTTYAQPAATQRSGDAPTGATRKHSIKPATSTTPGTTHVRPVVAPAPTVTVTIVKPAPSTSPSAIRTTAPASSSPAPSATTSSPATVTDPGNALVGDNPPSSPTPSTTESTTSPVLTLVGDPSSPSTVS